MSELYLNRSEVRIALLSRGDAEGLAAIDRLTMFTAQEVADLTPSKPEPDWQPIRTAPKDGSLIEIKYLSDDPRRVRWMISTIGEIHAGRWHLGGYDGPPIEFEPTEWRDVVPRSTAIAAEPDPDWKQDQAETSRLPRNREASPEPDAVRDRDAIAQALLDRFIERGAARFSGSTFPKGTDVKTLVRSYRDDFYDDANAVLAALSRPAHGGWEEALRRIRDFPHNDTMCEQAMAQIAREALADPRNDRGSEAQ